MAWLVHWQARDHPIGDTRVIVDERHGYHHPTHSQGGDQLVARCASAVDGNLGQVTGAGHEWHGQTRTRPVAEEVLAHREPQPTNHDQHQPPVIEDNGTGHQCLMIAIPVDHDAKHQGCQADRLEDRNQRIVSEETRHGAVHAEPGKDRQCQRGSADEKPGVIEYRAHAHFDSQADHERHQ
ncbi:hypothetical protein WR25_25698 [Diploscapter pachys]|uniref:Uncharacterized protein n=1 Tax=Diploscapter pachys TaxID=2018661 RepID=A0A2A2K649_9BILA|nr:hypothetical protein WR25_25698 [Diploscapter pachys]